MNMIGQANRGVLSVSNYLQFHKLASKHGPAEYHDQFRRLIGDKEKEECIHLGEQSGKSALT